MFHAKITVNEAEHTVRMNEIDNVLQQTLSVQASLSLWDISFGYFPDCGGKGIKTRANRKV